MSADAGRLTGRLIAVGVTGSIAAYKAVELVRLLRSEGADVAVLMTPSATRFVGPLSFSALSRYPVETDVLAAAEARLAALPLDAIPEIAPLPTGSQMPLRANPLFVGREPDLRALAAGLKGDPQGRGAAPTAAVCGLGGMGKTQLATELVHRYGQYFAGGVYWLSFAAAADVNRIERSGQCHRRARRRLARE